MFYELPFQGGSHSDYHIRQPGKLSFDCDECPYRRALEITFEVMTVESVD
jgi:hypothetical protein